MTICSALLGATLVLLAWVASDVSSAFRLDVPYVGNGIDPTYDDRSYALNQFTRHGTPTDGRASAEESDDATADVASNVTQVVNGTRRLPDAIIIGAKKSGTRALLRFLGAHPGVKTCGKEQHFFDKNFDRGFEWYRNQMPLAAPEQLVIEKTPSYFITPAAPARIHTMSPSTSLILVVRNPITRALSDYAQSLTKRPRPAPTFDDMAFNSTGHVDITWGAVRIGMYAQHLAPWLRYFPRSNLHVVNGERLVTDPGAELMEVQEFLHLDPVITREHFYYNSTKGFHCMKNPVNPEIPRCLGKSKGRAHPRVTPEALQQLKEFYRPQNEKFYQMMGENLGWD